jgi:hypothetical protein
MPLDPSIYDVLSRGRQAQPSPFDYREQRLRLRDLETRQQASELDLRKAQRDEQTAMAIRQVLQQAGGDLEKALPQIMAIAPEHAIQFQQLAEAAKQRRVQEEVGQRTAAIEDVNLFQGRSRAEILGRYGATGREQRQVGEPGISAPPVPEAPPSRVVGGVTVPGVAPQPAPLPAGFTQEVRYPEAVIPGVPGQGRPAARLRVYSGEELFQQKQAEEAAKRSGELTFELAKEQGKAEIQREANIYTITDPVNGKQITGPKELLDNYLTISQQNASREDQQKFDAVQKDLDRKASAANTQAQIGAANARAAADRAVRLKAAEITAGKDKPLSGDAAKLYGITTTALSDIEKLKIAFGYDPTTGKVNPRKYSMALAAWSAQMDRTLVKLIDNIADKVGRIRSGGAVNPAEEKRFKGQLASYKDLAFEDANNAIDTIGGIEAEFANTLEALTRGTSFAPTTGRMLRVVLPNGQEGEIPSDQWEQFLKENPRARKK